METLNHIIIYNLVFSSVSNYYIAAFATNKKCTDDDIAFQPELHL
jgi:hypothetical protein